MKRIAIVVLGIILISLPACNKAIRLEDKPAHKITEAVAVLQPINDSGVSGIVYFRESGLGVEIIADVNGLEAGDHGFHIHQYGDLRAEDGSTLGGHYTPTGKLHGGPTIDERHAGDLGNIYAVADSLAHYDRTQPGISINGENPILGCSIVIHSGEDNFTTQPSGNSGQRIAAGVIGIANTDM